MRNSQVRAKEKEAAIQIMFGIKAGQMTQSQLPKEAFEMVARVFDDMVTDVKQLELCRSEAKRNIQEALKWI